MLCEKGKKLSFVQIRLHKMLNDDVYTAFWKSFRNT